MCFDDSVVEFGDIVFRLPQLLVLWMRVKNIPTGKSGTVDVDQRVTRWCSFQNGGVSMEDILNDGAYEYNVFRYTWSVFRAVDSGGGGLICSWCFEVVRRA